jgi:Uma2 family endonuclease
VIHRLAKRFFALVGDRANVRIQVPLALSEDSEPEPDVAIVPAGDYSQGHPVTALLVVEGSDSTLRKDRGLKAELYAAAGIPEYWLVDLEANVVEVRSQPEGGRYHQVTEHSSGLLELRLLPGVQVLISELLA